MKGPKTIAGQNLLIASSDLIDKDTRGLDSVTLDNIRNFHRKCRHYRFAYLEGHVAGSKLEEQVKKYKVAVESHHRIGVDE